MKPNKKIDHPIHPILNDRWSPRSFSPKEIPSQELMSLLEAARWAPSAFNEQPWRFIYGYRGTEAFENLHQSLVTGNQSWTDKAAVLMLSFTKDSFDRNQKPNGHARHDLGLAVMSLSVEAGSRGIFVHQMAGIETDAIIERFSIPEGYTPTTAIALGYLADEENMSEEEKAAEFKVQSRIPIEAFAAEGKFVK